MGVAYRGLILSSFDGLARKNGFNLVPGFEAVNFCIERAPEQFTVTVRIA